MSFDAPLDYLDSPIESLEQDELSRGNYVQNVCRILRSPPLNESNVFAIYGEWGSGKTSVKNLVKKQWEKDLTAPLVIEFNPWAFSSQKEVMAAFFEQVGKGIGQKPGGKKVAESFQKLGLYLNVGVHLSILGLLSASIWTLPVTPMVALLWSISKTTKGLTNFSKELKELHTKSLEEIQAQLKSDLEDFNRLILIVIDDLDRIGGDQLLTVFQIVRQNARLRSVNYLLLMDRATVDQQLSKQNVGDKYIEKIVQFEFTLPHVSSSQLKDFLRKGFTTILDDKAKQIDWARWELYWSPALERIFTTMRRVKRFLHTFRFYVRMFDGNSTLEVDPVDLFMLEAIRLHAPEVHKNMATECRVAIGSHVNLSLAMLSSMRHDEKPFRQEILETLRKSCPEDRWTEIEALIKALFPQIGSTNPTFDDDEWVRDGRICHPLFYDTHFQLEVPKKQLSQNEISGFINAINSGAELANDLQRLCDKSSFHEVLRRLQCNHTKIEIQYLSNLLSILWDEDERIAAEHGVKQDMYGRDACQGFTRFFIRNNVPAEKRSEIMIKALKQSRSVYPVARFWRTEDHGLKKEPSNSNLSFSADTILPLRIAVVDRLKEAAADGRLLKNPDILSLLYNWADLPDIGDRKEWIERQIKDDDKLLTFLVGMIAKGTIGEKVIYYIAGKYLNEIIPDYTTLKPRLIGLKNKALMEWQYFAVKEVLARIDEKENNRPEPDPFRF